MGCGTAIAKVIDELGRIEYVGSEGQRSLIDRSEHGREEAAAGAAAYFRTRCGDQRQMLLSLEKGPVYWENLRMWARRIESAFFPIFYKIDL